MKPDLKAQTREELAAILAGWSQPSYRAGQILDWIYRSRAARWQAMTSIPNSLRDRLAAEFDLTELELVTVQGTDDSARKFLWRMADGARVESVLIGASPALYGELSDRRTLCISTQVGCAYGCRFCASGLGGWKRDLTAGEMVDQVLAVERWHAAQPAASEDRGRRLIDNLVVMGMGEPLANYDALLRALRLLNAPWGGGLGARKITVSSSGLCPEIRRLAEEPFQFRLAISLHGATDDVRSLLMPINRRYPLRELVRTCEHYRSRRGRMITFEYVLIAGVNDTTAQAQQLAELARPLCAKVNLIPYNRVDGLAWERPSPAAQEAFLQMLIGRGISATLRLEKGHDIDAACGQLRLRTERAEASGLAPSVPAT